MNDGDFRIEIETMLRQGQADAAADRLRGMLSAVCAPEGPLPARVLAIGVADVVVGGWEGLAGAFEAHLQMGRRISAVGVDFASPSHHGRVPDADGCLEPEIETALYCDGPGFAFSGLDLAGVRGCYAPSRGKWLGKANWQGMAAAVEDVLTVSGIGDLYGAVYRLTKDVSVTGGAEARAVGAAYLAVLVHLAVRDAVGRGVLPWPVAVIVGSNGDYPFFSAAVAGAV